mmetsp:Transcript_8886/g.14400  ORF Transcript_8886/g.14400 Transcript_8886/m.14400 type:complete len:214 (-) Transcript_8886:14-655(-)
MLLLQPCQRQALDHSTEKRAGLERHRAKATTTEKEITAIAIGRVALEISAVAAENSEMEVATDRAIATILNLKAGARVATPAITVATPVIIVATESHMTMVAIELILRARAAKVVAEMIAETAEIEATPRHRGVTTIAAIGTGLHRLGGHSSAQMPRMAQAMVIFPVYIFWHVLLADMCPLAGIANAIVGRLGMTTCSPPSDKVRMRTFQKHH